MNRSRPSPVDAAETLLEAGRTQPALHYDVELGLERHHHWLRSEAPVPEWANASAGTAAKVMVSAAIKTIVSVVLIAALGVAVWHARGRPQRSMAAAEHSVRAPDRTTAVATNVRAVKAPDAWLATTPIPVPAPEQSPANDPPMVSHEHERTTHVQRAHKQLLAVPNASARAVPASQNMDTPSVPVERSASAAPPAQEPDDLAEMQQVATAEKLLDRSPQHALALMQQGDQRFASGYFQQERAYIAIMALIRLGRIEEARVRAATFAKRFPALPYGARIRSALEARQRP